MTGRESADESDGFVFPQRWGLSMRIKIIVLPVVMACCSGMSACRDAELSSYECPSAAQLSSGVNVRCGDNIVTGTLDATTGGLANCKADGETDCVAKAPFKVANTTNLTPSRIKEGNTVAGVVGNIGVEGVGECTVDGETRCYVDTGFLGAQISTLPAKLAVGKTVGEVQGTAVVSDAAACSSNAQVGCLTSSSYVAMRNDLATACLLNGGGSLNLTGESPTWRMTDRGVLITSTTAAQAACLALEATPANSNWRLPTKREALQFYLSGTARDLVDSQASSSLKIWTTDSSADQAGKSWTVDLITGETIPAGNPGATTRQISTVCISP